MSGRRKMFLLILVTLCAFPLAGCPFWPNSATTASCAFISGNGQDGNNSKLHRVVYPDQSLGDTAGETVKYVPCNSRNFIDNPKDILDANNHPVGDRHVPMIAYTKTGTGVQIWGTVYWTLNQSEVALKEFYNVCHKYNCYSITDVGGGTNYSTDGWNGMLGETFGPTLDRVANIAADKAKIEDSIWKTQDSTQKQILAEGMSAIFAENVRKTFGYSHDLFCGSGDSGWLDPENPGKTVGKDENTFRCTAVRIVIDKVEPLPTTNQTSEGAKLINQIRLDNARVLYGSKAEEVLGAQDTLKICLDAGSTTCAVNAGGTGFILIPSNPTPTPAPTPKK
jgi:hypothetical protein